MENSKFIFKIESSELENNVEINTFSVNQDNDVIVDIKTLNYEIFISKNDFEKLNIKSPKIIVSLDKFYNKNDETILKIEILSKELYNYILSQIKDANFTLYEQDISYEAKYLIEHDINLLESKNNTIKYIPLKYVSIDIESIGKDMQNQEIILLSLYSLNNLAKVYINIEKLNETKIKEIKKKKFTDFETIYCNNEKDLLQRAKEEIILFSPQAIVGWNVIDFDFKVIKDRMKLHSIEFKLSKYDGECKLRINNDFFKDSTLTVPGVLVFDVIQLLKMNYIVFEDYKLDTVAKQVLLDQKIELDYNLEETDEMFEDKIKVIENMYYNNTEKLIEYNFKDSLLVSKIIEKLKLLELMCKRSILTGTPLLRVKSPIATLDIMYLKELHKRKLVAPSNFNFDQSAPIEGAFVISPEKGFYEDIFVFDFKSLYPSIIMTFNIDPFTYSKTGPIVAPNGAKFEKEPGILAELILKLYLERDIAKKEKDKIKSHALKITMNSFYGTVASPKSRFHNRDVGGAITAFGREIIQKTKLFIENKGHKVIYGDTDSIFVKFNREFLNLEEKEKFGKYIQKEINEYFENLVKTEFEQKNYLNIEHEKIFSKFFIASKKRYVGYDEISKELKYVGMEAIRGDWTNLAQNFQRELVDLIFEGKNKEKIEKFILDYVNNLKTGKYNDLLIYTKKITKPLALYTKTTPPHVRAAREVPNFAGKIVKYVMTKDGPKHINILKEPIKYDYDHYIEKQLNGVADDLLEAFGVDFNKVTQGTKQNSLNRFF